MMALTYIALWEFVSEHVIVMYLMFGDVRVLKFCLSNCNIQSLNLTKRKHVKLEFSLFVRFYFSKLKYVFVSLSRLCLCCHTSSSVVKAIDCLLWSFGLLYVVTGRRKQFTLHI